MSRLNTQKDNFNTICELFCHLANELETGGYRELAEIINHLMSVWLSKSLIK